MIFVANGADFSAKNIGQVDFVYDETEGENGVTVLVSSIQIKPLSGNPKVGDKIQLKAIVLPLNAYMRNDLSWSVSNTSIATVDDTGFLTILDEGSFTVMATAKDGSEVAGSMSITAVPRTIADMTEQTQTILGYYTSKGRVFTDAEKIALDTLLVRIGVQYEDSAWSKVRLMILPCLGSSMDNALINIVTGIDNLTYRTNATTERNNGKLVEGNVTYNTGTVAIPLRLASSTNSFTINKGYTFIVGGCKFTLQGGSNIWSRWAPTFNSTSKVFHDSRTGYTCGATLSRSALRGGTCDMTQAGTFLAPKSLILSEDRSGLQAMIDAIKAATWYHDNGTLNISSASGGMYCYAYGDCMTQRELELIIFSLNKFFVAMGVNTTKFE